MATAVGLSARNLTQADSTRWKEIASAATCLRCGGLMVAEPCSDFWDDAKNVAVRRCVQCGELFDPVILQNRQRLLDDARTAEGH
jgi:hypothetical protein